MAYGIMASQRAEQTQPAADLSKPNQDNYCVLRQRVADQENTGCTRVLRGSTLITQDKRVANPLLQYHLFYRPFGSAIYTYPEQFGDGCVKLH